MLLAVQLIILFILSLVLAPLVLRCVTFLLTRFGCLDRPHLYKSEK